MSGAICKHGVNSIDRGCPVCTKATGDALMAAFTVCGDLDPHGCVTCTKKKDHPGGHRYKGITWPRGGAECHEDDIS